MFRHARGHLRLHAQVTDIWLWCCRQSSSSHIRSQGFIAAHGKQDRPRTPELPSSRSGCRMCRRDKESPGAGLGAACTHVSVTGVCSWELIRKIRASPIHTRRLNRQWLPRALLALAATLAREQRVPGLLPGLSLFVSSLLLACCHCLAVSSSLRPYRPLLTVLDAPTCADIRPKRCRKESSLGILPCREKEPPNGRLPSPIDGARLLRVRVATHDRPWP